MSRLGTFLELILGWTLSCIVGLDSGVDSEILGWSLVYILGLILDGL